MGHSERSKRSPSRGTFSPAAAVLVGLILSVGLVTPAVAANSAAASATLDEDPSGSASVGVDQPAPGVTDSITRLYLAVFDRMPDVGGRQYWVGQYTGGVALDRIATSFMASGEWEARYGAIDDGRFVDLLYGNVLRRTPDAKGRRYWLDVMAGGGTATGRAPDRAELLLYFSESAEFVATTGTASPVAPPPRFPQAPIDSGSGRRIVYSNSAQRVWLINDDETIHDSYLVSGRRQTPNPGTYSVFSKSPKAWAGHDGITMDHMVRFTYGRRLAIGFHSIPTYADGAPMQTLDQLGTHQSAGCVRQSAEKAAALYDWAEVGATVVVLA